MYIVIQRNANEMMYKVWVFIDCQFIKHIICIIEMDCLLFMLNMPLLKKRRKKAAWYWKFENIADVLYK